MVCTNMSHRKEMPRCRTCINKSDHMHYLGIDPVSDSSTGRFHHDSSRTIGKPSMFPVDRPCPTQVCECDKPRSASGSFYRLMRTLESGTFTALTPDPTSTAPYMVYCVPTRTANLMTLSRLHFVVDKLIRICYSYNSGFV